MKIRNIPFGYRIENGKILLHPAESQTVREIHAAYLNGQSLLQIAASLNERGVEYMPGTAAWNKARLKRIIEDVRYLGNEAYPAILQETDFNRAQEIKAARNTKKDVDRTADIFKLTVPVCCENCGEPLRRMHDSRTIHQEKWICRSCNSAVKIPDAALLTAIVECMNRLIADPGVIRYTPAPTEPSLETLRLKNEIGRMLDSPIIDKEPLKSKIFEYASRMYDGMNTGKRITERIRAALENAEPLSSYDKELIEKTVAAVTLHGDRTVSFTLKNGQQTGKGDANAAGTGETGTHHRADHRAGECVQHTVCNQTGSGILPGIHQTGRTAEQL